MEFENINIEIKNFIFETNVKKTTNDNSGGIQLELKTIEDHNGAEKCVVKAKTTANYSDEKFVINAKINGAFVLSDVKEKDIEEDEKLQEKLGIELLTLIYNKLNMYVSIFSQEVYDSPIYPSQFEINVKKVIHDTK